MKPILMAALSALLAVPAAAQQTPTTAELQKAQGANYAKDWDDHIHNDFGFLDRYRQANADLPTDPKEPRVVLLGDSITQGWVDKAPATMAPNWVGRGVSGQTTPQMLVRFRQDVIDLHPAVVQIMAGTNDIAGNTGPMTPEQTEANVRDMVELAQAHGIRVILASIPPSAGFPWKPGLAVTDRIEALNAWLKRYAAATGSTYADYWAALQDGKGGMKPGLASDGVHPTPAGYKVMQPVAEAAVRAALARPKPTHAVIAQ